MTFVAVRLFSYVPCGGLILIGCAVCSSIYGPVDSEGNKQCMWMDFAAHVIVFFVFVLLGVGWCVLVMLLRCFGCGCYRTVKNPNDDNQLMHRIGQEPQGPIVHQAQLAPAGQQPAFVGQVVPDPAQDFSGGTSLGSWGAGASKPFDDSGTWNSGLGVELKPEPQLSLSDQLRELQQVRNQGLLTEEEYQKARATALQNHVR